MNGVSLGDTLVGWNEYGANIEIVNGIVEDTVGFVIGERSPVFRMDNDDVECTPSTAALVSRSKMSILRPAGSQILVLRTTCEALERRFCEVTGYVPKGGIQFDRSVDISTGIGLVAKQTLTNIVSQLETDDSLVSNELLRVATDDLLLGLLLSLSINHGDLSHHDPGVVEPRILRQVEGFIEANYFKPIKIRDMVEACGYSSSLIYRAFHKYRSYTPSEFLTIQRLEAAHQRLTSPLPNDNVTSIALECGFAHLSRFAGCYKKRFNESPSESLWRSR
jgi:AraC-like DNA-binding protein